MVYKMWTKEQKNLMDAFDEWNELVKKRYKQQHLKNWKSNISRDIKEVNTLYEKINVYC